MKTKQFPQLAGLAPERRVSLVVEGLEAIGANVVKLAAELEQCGEAGAYRAARLLYNVGREEAGKFLVLIDAYRAPDAEPATISNQFKRAGDHLSKLLYAQVADYSIASQEELLRVVSGLRDERYLDGPTDCDWIFPNELLFERENALYVDLVDTEGELQWWVPHDEWRPEPVPRCMRLVQALLATGLVSSSGLEALPDAWTGFDPHQDSSCGEWARRTRHVLEAFPDHNIQDDGWSGTASFVADRWPMPMTQLDVSKRKVSVEELEAEREARHDYR